MKVVRHLHCVFNEPIGEPLSEPLITKLLNVADFFVAAKPKCSFFLRSSRWHDVVLSSVDNTKLQELNNALYLHVYVCE